MVIVCSKSTRNALFRNFIINQNDWMGKQAMRNMQSDVKQTRSQLSSKDCLEACRRQIVNAAIMAFERDDFKISAPNYIGAQGFSLVVFQLGTVESSPWIHNESVTSL